MPGILDLLSQTWPARLAQDVWGGITAPRDAWQGKLDALSPEGIARAGNLAGFIMGGSMAAPAQRNAAGTIRAYHGSPYDFEKFDLSKIGTGEGAQAYGHGLYFAENPSVAADYRRRLGGLASNEDAIATGALQTVGGDARAAAAELRRQAVSGGEWGQGITPELFGSIASKLESGWIPAKGRMYEVNINAKPEQFLDWDKPLAQQSKQIQEFWREQFRSNEPPKYRGDIPVDPNAGFHVPEAASGEAIYRGTTPGFVSSGPYKEPLHAEASRAFREASIPGIKYLDQGSRNAGEGSSNYVLFRDDIIDILRKYGLIGTAAGLGATSDQLPIPSQPAPIYAQ